MLVANGINIVIPQHVFGSTLRQAAPLLPLIRHADILTDQSDVSFSDKTRRRPMTTTKPDTFYTARIMEDISGGGGL